MTTTIFNGDFKSLELPIDRTDDRVIPSSFPSNIPGTGGSYNPSTAPVLKSSLPSYIPGQGAQPTENFEAPSANVKSAEAVSKLTKDGKLDDFSKITPGVAVTPKMDGTTSLTDPVTKKDIVSKITTTKYANIDPKSLTSAEKDSFVKTSQNKVIISQKPSFGNDYMGTDTIVFDVMPNISESGSASYESFQPIQHPGEILKYKGSSARTWSVSAKLMARTPMEAQRNLEYINLIRAWRMPFYGEGTANDPAMQKYLGAPPPILTLSAYGNKVIGPTTVVLESYNWDWPNEVDYIETELTRNPFPVLMSVTLNFKEAYSPAEYSGFDLRKYRNGDLGTNGAFKSIGMAKKTPTGTKTGTGGSATDKSGGIKQATPKSLATPAPQAAAPKVKDVAATKPYNKQMSYGESLNVYSKDVQAKSPAEAARAQEYAQADRRALGDFKDKK